MKHREGICDECKWPIETCECQCAHEWRQEIDSPKMLKCELCGLLKIGEKLVCANGLALRLLRDFEQSYAMNLQLWSNSEAHRLLKKYIRILEC